MNIHSQSSSEAHYPQLGFFGNVGTAGVQKFLYKSNNSSAPPSLFEIGMGSSATERWHLTDLAIDLAEISPVHGRTTILRFCEEPYEVVSPIPVSFRKGGLGEFVATFAAANISFVDQSLAEALSGLEAEILNTYEDYEAHESQLGPEPKRQLAVLRKHIRHKK